MKLPDDFLYKMPTDYDKIQDEVNRKFIKNLLYAIGDMYREIALAVNLNVDLLRGQEKSEDPPDPDEGNFVLWMSDGTDTGDDGDILIKITAGGSTKTHTLVDFSAI